MLGVRRNRESAEYSCSTLRLKTHVNSLVSATLDNRGVEAEELCSLPWFDTHYASHLPPAAPMANVPILSSIWIVFYSSSDLPY